MLYYHRSCGFGLDSGWAVYVHQETGIGCVADNLCIMLYFAISLSLLVLGSHRRSPLTSKRLSSPCQLNGQTDWHARAHHARRFGFCMTEWSRSPRSSCWSAQGPSSSGFCANSIRLRSERRQALTSSNFNLAFLLFLNLASLVV